MGVDAMSVEDLKKLNKNKKLVKKLGECRAPAHAADAASAASGAPARTKGDCAVATATTWALVKSAIIGLQGERMGVLAEPGQGASVQTLHGRAD